MRVRGHLDVAIIDDILRLADRRLADGVTIELYLDWEAAASYDSRARSNATRWLITHRDRVARVYVVAGSRMLAMGVSVAEMALATVGYEIHGVSRVTLSDAIEARLRDRR